MERIFPSARGIKNLRNTAPASEVIKAKDPAPKNRVFILVAGAGFEPAASGAPTGLEFGVRDGGAVQNFAKNRSICWSPRTGGQPVYWSGSIGGRYTATGYENSYGFPTMAESGIHGGVMQKFARANGATTALYWSATHGRAHAVWEPGAIGVSSPVMGAPSPTPSPEETVTPTEPEPTSAPTDSPVEPVEPENPAPTDPVEPETPVEPVDPEVPVEPTPTPEEPAPEEPAPAFVEEEQTLIVGDVHDFQVTGVPTADAEVKFTLTDSANVVIELRDADGELKAYIIRTADENGEVILTLDTQGLAPGEYTLTATVGDKEVTTKIIVSPSESEPTDPVDPVVPEQPVEPVNPVVPVEPVEPVEPVQPVDPVVPEQPVEPVEPAEPVVPTEPIQPEVPAEPAPTEPLQPESPAPAEPVEPTNPANPAIENLPVTEEHQLEATDLDTAELINIIEALQEPTATRIPDTLLSATATPQRETASREFSETLEALIPSARENSTLELREFTSNLQAGAAPGRQADAQDLQNGDTASPAPAHAEQEDSQDSTSSQADADTEQAASSTFDWFKALFAALGASFIGLAAWLVFGRRGRDKNKEEI